MAALAFNLLRNLHIVFHSVYSKQHPHQRCVRNLFYPHPYHMCYLLLLKCSEKLNKSSLISNQWVHGHKENGLPSAYGTLLRWSCAICDNIYESGDNMWKWNKPHKKRWTLYDPTHMWIYKRFSHGNGLRAVVSWGLEGSEEADSWERLVREYQL